MSKVRDYDNRDLSDVENYLRARIEVLEAENQRLKNVLRQSLDNQIPTAEELWDHIKKNA